MVVSCYVVILMYYVYKYCLVCFSTTTYIMYGLPMLIDHLDVFMLDLNVSTIWMDVCP